MIFDSINQDKICGGSLLALTTGEEEPHIIWIESFKELKFQKRVLLVQQTSFQVSANLKDNHNVSKVSSDFLINLKESMNCAKQNIQTNFKRKFRIFLLAFHVFLFAFHIWYYSSSQKRIDLFPSNLHHIEKGGSFIIQDFLEETETCRAKSSCPPSFSQCRPQAGL
jgi:hypothetical protein